jgi:single-strand DNA-binding protein
MSSVNKVILIGNLGRDPEIRHMESGKLKATFPVATSESYRNKEGERVSSATEWHNVVLWSPLAEIAEKYLKKGRQVFIEGRLNYRSYEDKTGTTKYFTEIVGRELTLLGGRMEGDQGAQADAKPEVAEPMAKSKEVDDLPF